MFCADIANMYGGASLTEHLFTTARILDKVVTARLMTGGDASVNVRRLQTSSGLALPACMHRPIGLPRVSLPDMYSTVSETSKAFTQRSRVQQYAQRGTLE